jgi:hypothetical protein
MTAIEESTFFEGSLYQTNDGEHWTTLGTGGNTLLGHVFESLGRVGEFSELGLEMLDGVQLHHLQPSTDPGFDVSFWGLEPSLLEAFVVRADVYADDGGIPHEVHLEIGFRHSDLGPVIWNQVYRLSQVGELMTIEQPEAWNSLSSLGYEALADMLVPASWVVEMHEGGTILLGSPVGHRLGVNITLYGSVDAETALRNLLRAFELEPESVEGSDEGVFPAASALVAFESPTASYAEVRTAGLELEGTSFSHVALGIVLSAPGDDELQDLLRDLTSTIRWRNPDTLSGSAALVPGETLADHVVQSDTLNILMPRFANDPTCENPFIAHTDLISGSLDGWAEDWYVACEQLMVVRIDYSLVPAGGFSIAVGPSVPVDG